MTEFLEKAIKKHEAAAEQARTVLDESLALEKKIRAGLNQFEYEITKAKTSAEIVESNILGSLANAVVYSKSTEGRIADFEAELNTHQRFLNRTSSIREELRLVFSKNAEPWPLVYAA